MFTNLILHLCQSDCLCRCQMYLFRAFYVTYGGNYKKISLSVRLASIFDWRFIDYTFGHFSQVFTGEVSITLLLHTHFCNRSNIYLLSSSGGKPFPDIVCDCCCSWAQHNIGHSTSNVEHTPSSIARLKLDGASGCGITCYREELRIKVQNVESHKDPF